MVVVVVVVIREMQKRRSEVEMVKREGRNWRTVATEQRMRRAVKRSLSSAAQFHTTPRNTFFSPPAAAAFSLSLAIFIVRTENREPPLLFWGLFLINPCCGGREKYEWKWGRW
ncbi:unnamed protein product [Linum tenue]|uniref:Transmembrane protein n=1 Tax=Linum tenue TaxID=586396 RepID=A0AAV0I7S8_9ROSI|nr:unnamed protein product [Linum tenue]